MSKQKSESTSSSRASLMSRSLDVTSLRALFNKDVTQTPTTTTLPSRAQPKNTTTAASKYKDGQERKLKQAMTSSVQLSNRLQVRSVQSYGSSIGSRSFAGARWSSALMSASMTSFRSQPTPELPTVCEEPPAFIKKQKIRFYVGSRTIARRKGERGTRDQLEGQVEGRFAERSSLM